MPTQQPWREDLFLVAPVHFSGFTWRDQPVHMPVSDPHTGANAMGFAHGQGYSLRCLMSVRKGTLSSWEKQSHARTQTWWAKFPPLAQVQPARDRLSCPAYTGCQVWIMHLAWSWVWGLAHAAHEERFPWRTEGSQRTIRAPCTEGRIHLLIYRIFIKCPPCAGRCAVKTVN